MKAGWILRMNSASSCFACCIFHIITISFDNSDTAIRVAKAITGAKVTTLYFAMFALFLEFEPQLVFCLFSPRKLGWDFSYEPIRAKKSLSHVAMVSKFLDDNKRKTSLKKWIRTASNFIDLIQFHLIWQILAKFSRLESERTISEFRKRKRQLFVVFTYSIKWASEIMKFRVAGVQRRQRNVQKSVMHVQICSFVNKNLLLFCPRRRWFCCQPQIMLPWWRDDILLPLVPVSGQARSTWAHVKRLYKVIDNTAFQLW